MIQFATFIYMIYVIYPLSKMKNEGRRVSSFTKLIVYGLLILSAFISILVYCHFYFSPLPFWLSSCSCYWWYDAVS